MHIAIIGAGAAGCFAAIELKRRLPECQVTLMERGRKALAKVSITGGGRCNLTNSFAQVNSMATVYPRGERLMKRLLNVFGQNDTMAWFENEGVRLIVQEDECVFPRSQDALEIVRTLLYRIKGLGIHLLTNCRVTNIHPKTDNTYTIDTAHGQTVQADCVLIATGGSPSIKGLDFLNELSLETISPVPSLYSLQLNERELSALMGTTVNTVSVGLTGTKLKATGTLLITHWGVSGPAILRLSSYGARILNAASYQHTLRINWLGETNETEAAEMLHNMMTQTPQKLTGSTRPKELNTRLWQYLLRRSGWTSETRWRDVGKKQINRLVSTLTNDTYTITNRCPFKDEFVTCGGVALNNINPKTLECKQYPGLYFAGEVLDVDAITGGFNLQAAWTMGYVAAQAIEQKYKS